MVGWVVVGILVGCSSASDPRPNILVIVADDLGYTDLGSFGGEIQTPHLDGLARSGLRFTNFHAGPSCAPTRAMLMTGLDHHLAGMGSQGSLATDNQQRSPAYQNTLSREVPTIAEKLRAAGYATLASAKWHLGKASQDLPGARGFDRSLVLLEGGGGHFDATPLFKSYGQATWLEDDAPLVLPEDFYSSDFMTTKLLSYIAAVPQDRPYFAYLGYTAPHWPLQAPAADIDKYREVYHEGWDALREARMRGVRREGLVVATAQAVAHEPGTEVWAALDGAAQAVAVKKMQVYAAMVDRLDQNVGRLLDALERRGDLDNTLIFFMADNGAEAHLMEFYAGNDVWVPENFDNRLDNIGTISSYVTLGPSWARATAAPFRDSKSKVAEGGIRVPAFLHWPGARVGIDTDYLRVMDLTPTFLTLAGAEWEHGGRSHLQAGRSALGNWLEGGPVYADEEFIAMEAFDRRMVQRGDWKALRQPPPYGTGQWQLYHVGRDPGEQEDLVEEHPEVLADLLQGYARYAEEVGVIVPDSVIPY
ncbi:MAG: arylsulfatase [Pseudomonadota bacterium]